MANEVGELMKARKQIEILNSSIEVLSDEFKKQEEKIKKLEFMIDNGLGWEDMKGGNIEDVQ